MIRSLLLSLLLAVPAPAQTRVEADAGASAGIPRVSPVVSPLSAPAPTLSATPSLTAASAPSFAPAPLAAPSIAPAPLPAAAAALAPVEANAAASLPAETPGKLVAAPEAAAAPESSAAPASEPTSRVRAFLRRLANPFGSRKTEPEEAPNGPPHPLLTGQSTSLELDGLRYEGGRLAQDGTPAAVLGRGTRGIVQAHPKIPGAIVKTVSMVGSANPLIAETESTPAALSEKEEATARALEALGAGPRYFGKAIVEERLVSVRERIYGKTLERMFSERSYGPREHALVLAMLQRLADGGVTSTDMKTANIMIGRTAANPEVRAYLVDGGALQPLTDVPAEKRLDAVLDTYVATNQAYGLASPLRKILDKGASRYKAPETPAPVSEAVRLDREFQKLDLWSQVGPAAKTEIEALRARKLSKAETKEYVRREVNAAFDRIKAARGTSNVGLHYNLHGGRREDYVGAGIRASKGDIALRYTTSGDTNDKVYFFQTAHAEAYAALDASNGEILYFPSRMGYALNLFDVDAPEIKAALADGRITNHGSISMDFHKGMRGIPYSAYLAPPVEVFVKTAKKVGLKKLTRDEETLATARFLEAVALAGRAYVP